MSAVLSCAAAAGAGWVGFGSAGAAVGLSGGVLVAVVVTVGRQRRQQQQVLRREEEVAEGCQLLAGLLRVGHVPTLALRLAAGESSVFLEADAAVRVGASVPVALRSQARRPGEGALAELATAWEVSERTGASLTATLDALAARLADARTVSRTVISELAAPRATGQILAVLPAFGLGLGYLIGGDPGRFLLGSPVGQVCLVLGVALAAVGLLWIERIAAVAEPPE